MASNSPGSFLECSVFNENQEYHVVSGLQTDVTDAPGKFQLNVAGGFQRDASLMVRDSGYMSTSDGASTCSSSTAEMCDLEGGTLLLLESKSLRSFITNDEYLLAMKEDLAEWFSSLYQNYEITADSFFNVLETGVLLCKHANKVQEVAKQQREMGETLEMRSYFIRSVPEGNIPYKEGVRPETFQARDNISNFISWTRLLGIPEVLSFETDDLVLRKNEKSVILCLLEVARVGAKLGMLAPTLVQMEEEIDAELAGEEPQPRVQIQTCDLRSLDERVRDLISRCTCPVQFPMIKVSDGKYKIGDTKSLIFVRILRNHVMVRVGGGWDTLENYLNKHDPCQCNYRGHRAGAVGVTHKVGQQRRSSHPGNNIFQTPNTPVSQKIVSSVTNTTINRSASPQNSSRSSSPNLIISRNMPASSKIHAGSNSASKGVHMTPGENQQELIAGTWPCHPSKSGDLIRCSSPSPSRLRTPSPLTVVQQSTPSSVVPNKTTSVSSALLSRKDTKENTVKTFKPTKSAVPSVNRDNEEYLAVCNNVCFGEGDENTNDRNWENRSDPRSTFLAGHGHMMTQTSHLQKALELTSSHKTNTVEIGSALELPKEQQHDVSVQNSEMLIEHFQTFSHSPAEAWSSVTEKGFPEKEMMPPKVTMKQMDLKNASGSPGSAGAHRTIRRNSLPQISGVTHGLSSAAVTDKQKGNKVFQNNDDKTKGLIVSHSKIQPLTQRTASLQIARKVSPTPRKAKDKGNKILSTKLFKDANKDTVFQANSANFEWSESTNEAHLTEISSRIPNIQSQSKAISHSLGYVPKSSANDFTAEDYIPISPQKDTIPIISPQKDTILISPQKDTILISPQKDTLGSTPRERPASSSRIPKPQYSARPSTPRTPLTSDSKYDSKSNTGLPQLSSQKHLHLGSINTVSGNKPLAASKSNNSLSSVKSSDEIPLSPSSNICNESLKPLKSVVHNTNILDNVDSSNSADHRLEDISSEEEVETFDKNTTELNKLNDKPREGNSNFSVLENTDVPIRHQRNSLSGITSQAIAVDVLQAASPDVTNFETQEDMIINDITFSDDEEVNELIKNLALKKKEDANNVQSKGSWTKKYVLQKSKRNEALMIRRNSSGHHAVQHEDKCESIPDSKSVLRSQSSANYKDFLTNEKGHTKSSSKNDVMSFEDNMNLSVESKDLLEKTSAVPSSSLGNIPFSRTEAWVDSTLPGNT